MPPRPCPGWLVVALDHDLALLHGHTMVLARLTGSGINVSGSTAGRSRRRLPRSLWSDEHGHERERAWQATCRRLPNRGAKRHPLARWSSTRRVYGYTHWPFAIMSQRSRRCMTAPVMPVAQKAHWGTTAEHWARSHLLASCDCRVRSLDPRGGCLVHHRPFPGTPFRSDDGGRPRHPGRDLGQHRTVVGARMS